MNKFDIPNIVNKISVDYDAEVKEWACSLMEKPSQPVRVIHAVVNSSINIYMHRLKLL